MVKASIMLGTRPEAIKLAPLFLAMEEHAKFATLVYVSGQHHKISPHYVCAHPYGAPEATRRRGVSSGSTRPS